MIKYFFLIFCIPLILSSQSDLPIGSWTTHLPYNAGIQVTQSDEFVYYSTGFSILQINKNDYSFQKISRTEGLSGNQINCIYFHKATKTLVIAYSDGLIDLLTEHGVIAIPDIQIYNNVPINKTIRSITFEDDIHVFINADYGLSSLDLVSHRMSFTTFTDNLIINSTLSFEGKVYSGSNKGLYVFDPSTKNLIEDFNSWNLIGTPMGLDPNVNYPSLTVFNNQLFASDNTTVYQLNQNSFEIVFKESNFSVQFLTSEGPDLLIGLTCDNSCGNKISIIKKDETKTEFTGDCVSENLWTIQDPKGVLWMADHRWGYRRAISIKDPCQSIFVNGPFSNNLYEITPTSDGVFVASGGIDAKYTYVYRADGVLSYKNKQWDVMNGGNVPVFSQNNIRDILRVVEHPDGNKLYFASFGAGVIEYDKVTQVYTLFNASNTNGILGVAIGDETRVRISGLAFNKIDKSLWIADFLAGKALVSYSNDKVWRSYKLNEISTEVIDVKVDNNGYKWIIPRESSGVLVFDEQDPNNPNDDRSILLNNSNTNMVSNRVNTVEVDLEGDVWVGTDQGAIVFECGSSIFEGTCKGSRRKVDQDGIIAYLLETESVISIGIDGANRKWFGTRNGLYVQSSNGEDQVLSFNTKNSPLMGNVIYDVVPDQKTGDVWIGTDGGIQVYRSDAVAARNVFSSSIYAFPNPVNANYSGPIAITGLSRDARVKITDISGRLVYETIANGGQAIWDGKDYLGRKAASGIYLVFANSTRDLDASEGIVTQILITR